MVDMSVTLVAGWLLLLATIHQIKRQLTNGPPESVPRRRLACLAVVEGVTMIATLVGLGVVIPHPSFWVLLVLLAAGVVWARQDRYRDETLRFNELLWNVAANAAPLPETIERFAATCGSSLGQRARRFAFGLRCGEPVALAARRSGLSVRPDALLANEFLVNEATDRLTHHRSSADRRGPEATGSAGDRAADANWKWQRRQQAVYGFTLVVVSLVLGTFLHAFVFPTIVKMTSEFTSESLVAGTLDHIAAHDAAIAILDQVNGGLFFSLIIVLALRLLAELWPFRWWPRSAWGWFTSPRWRDRSTMLAGLGYGLAAGQTDVDWMSTAAQSCRRRWWRARAAAVDRRLRSGQPLVAALWAEQWIDSAERTWLHSGNLNGRLPESLIELSRQIERRQCLRWQTWMAWAFPALLIAAGGYIFLHGWVLLDATSLWIFNSV